MEFYGKLRQQHSVNELCGVGSDSEIKFCTELISGLDRWNGQALKESWQPSLLYLWYQKVKESLWPPGMSTKDKSRSELFTSWARSVGSTRIVHRLLNDPKTVEAWEKLSKRNFKDTSLVAFQESLQILMRELGPVTDRWQWGFLHKIRWQHPFALMPEPLGPMLRDALLGIPPPVPGGADSPGRFDFEWRVEKPLEFSSTHGSVTRMCSTLRDGKKINVEWSIPTGVSGNPFSKWSKVMPYEYFFKDKLFLSDE